MARAVCAGGDGTDHLLLRALADGERNSGTEIGDDVGCSGRQRLLGRRTAAKGDELDVEAGCLEVAELFSGKRRRIVGALPIGKTDANFLGGSDPAAGEQA